MQKRWLYYIVRFFIAVAVPILLTLISVRAVMTPLFLTIEYHRPDFPPDGYGFSQEDRLTYAPMAVAYLLNGEDIHFLGDLQLEGALCYPPLPQGRQCSMFNERELRHMVDVKIVTQAAFTILVAGIAFFIGAVLWLRRSLWGRTVLREGLQQGAIITLSIIGAIIIGAVVAWDSFFDSFHAIFFESGTWRFLYSDTLIRLFPEKFWFDAAIVVGGMTALGAVAILIWSWRAGKATRETKQ